MFTQTTQQEATVFNMGIATLMRMNETLIKLNMYNEEGNPLKIERMLKVLYKEVKPFLTKEEVVSIHSQMVAMTLSINVNEKGEPVCSHDINELFDSIEEWLRDRMLDKGLLMAKGDDPSRAILGGGK